MAAAQEALGLLVGAGDLTGALDVLGDLRAAAAPAAAAGLAALRPLPQQLAAAGAVRATLPSVLRDTFITECVFHCLCKGLAPAASSLVCITKLLLPLKVPPLIRYELANGAGMLQTCSGMRNALARCYCASVTDTTPTE